MDRPHFHPLEPMLRKLQQWEKLNAADRQAVLDLPHTVERVEAARYIVREGDRPKHSCLLVSGFAFRQKVVADGSRSISAIHLRGDMVDLQNSLLREADHSVQALNNCTIALIPREAVRQIAFAFPNVGMAMWYDTLVDASIFREWLANIGRRSATAGLAHLICEMGLRFEVAGLGNRQHFELPMTQEQLADCTGLTAVHVNRTLKALEANGLISRSMRHVSIADWDRLTEVADFQSSYLHVPQASLHAA